MPASAGRSVERIYYTVQRGRKTPRCAAVSANDGGNGLEIIERFSRTDAYERLAYPYKPSSRIKGVTGHMKQWADWESSSRGICASSFRFAWRSACFSPSSIGVLKPIVPALFRLYDVSGRAQQHLSPGSRGVPPSAAPDSGAAGLGSAYSHRGVCHRVTLLWLQPQPCCRHRARVQRARGRHRFYVDQHVRRQRPARAHHHPDVLGYLPCDDSAHAQALLGATVSIDAEHDARHGLL